MPDECNALIQAYLDGTATDAEVRELDRLLAGDGLVRRKLIEDSAFDARLRMVLARQAAAGGVGQGADAAAAGRMRSRGPLAHPGVWGGWVAAAAVLIAVVVAFWHLTPSRPGAGPALPPKAGVPLASVVEPSAGPPPLASVMQVKGQVALISSRTPESGLVHVQTAIFPGDVLEAGREARTQVQYADGSRLTLYGGSRVSFEPSSAGILLQVDAGAVDASINPQPAGKPMVVYTGRFTAEVVGTEFRVIEEKSASWLAVKSGRVLVTRNSDGRRVGLNAGRYATVNPRIPYGGIPVGCPVWRGQCKVSAGDQYP